jgi:hypothetical protein
MQTPPLFLFERPFTYMLAKIWLHIAGFQKNFRFFEDSAVVYP